MIASEDRLIRITSLKSVLRTATSRLRTLSLSGDEQDKIELIESLSRGDQLLDRFVDHSPNKELNEILARCRRYFSDIKKQVPDARSAAKEETTSRRAQSQLLVDQLDEQAVSEQNNLSALTTTADRERREAKAALITGHVVMLGVIGLLYLARRAERKLRIDADRRNLATDERFSLVVRGSADGIILTDDVGRVQLVNPAFCEMIGADEQTLVGQPVGSLFATTAIDEWLANALDPHESGTPRTVLAKRADGREFVAELTITTSVIHQQEFLAISVRDVTDREESRIRLKQHEAMLSEIPEPLHILDAVGRVVYWNRGAQSLFGYESDEAIGQTAGDLLRIVPPESDDSNIHTRDYAEAERWTGELRATTKDNRILRIERRRTRVSENGETIGEVIFDFDLGERNRSQHVQRRRQRLESLGTLASGIAHDLNNLLTPILMSSRMLQRDSPNVDRNALLDTIASGASRGADLISQLLTFARGGDGQHQVLDVQNLLPEIIVILQHTLPSSVTLRTEIAADLPEIYGDETEISQVVMNLAINARDAMTTDGKLTIGARRMVLDAERSYSYATLQPGQYLAIEVSDTGTGIPPNVRDKMFDPFFTTKERGQGTGLGLSTSIGIVRSHRGAVEVKSVVGTGTTVTVIIPALQQIAPDHPAPAHSVSASVTAKQSAMQDPARYQHAPEHNAERGNR